MFANGDEYDGELKDTKPSGIGVLKFKNGNEYNGEFKDASRTAKAR